VTPKSWGCQTEALRSGVVGREEAEAEEELVARSGWVLGEGGGRREEGGGRREEGGSEGGRREDRKEVAKEPLHAAKSRGGSQDGHCRGNAPRMGQCQCQSQCQHLALPSSRASGPVPEA
jgi:hypothetical protein